MLSSEYKLGSESDTRSALSKQQSPPPPTLLPLSPLPLSSTSLSPLPLPSTSLSPPPLYHELTQLRITGYYMAITEVACSTTDIASSIAKKRSSSNKYRND